MNNLTNSYSPSTLMTALLAQLLMHNHSRRFLKQKSVEQKYKNWQENQTILFLYTELSYLLVPYGLVSHLLFPFILAVLFNICYIRL